MKQLSIYISGKITGDPQYKKKFADTERALNDAGFMAINPAVGPEGLVWEAYMYRSLDMLRACDAVCMLPGWEESYGATIERAWAGGVGKKARTLAEWTTAREV